MAWKAIILDDEYSGRASLKFLLKRDHRSRFSEICEVSSIDEAINTLKRCQYHICFLDIDLNGRSGFELLSHLQNGTKIIFVTAFSQFALRALKARAYDYLLKPIDPRELSATLERLSSDETNEVKKDGYLLIKDFGETVPIALLDIVYIEADGAYSEIYLVGGKKYVTSRTLKVLTSLLGKGFVRIHKSYLVNMLHIASYTKDSLTTQYNQCLPVSRQGSKELHASF